MAKVAIIMADYGHDPTETAVPYTAFQDAGFQVSFITEKGAPPRCDSRMLQGITQFLLGASRSVIERYEAMTASDAWKHPLAWSSPDFTLDPFHLVFLPGGHDKGVRQVIDSPAVHTLLADFFPKTKKPGGRAVGAVCHGVMVLSASQASDGKSVIHDCLTTALPARFEQTAFWGTRMFLGDYYKTYGAGSENVEESVTKALREPSQFRNSLGMSPYVAPYLCFVVEDETHNYISARWPGDAELLAEKLVGLVKELASEGHGQTEAS